MQDGRDVHRQLLLRGRARDEGPDAVGQAGAGGGKRGGHVRDGGGLVPVALEPALLCWVANFFWPNY